MRSLATGTGSHDHQTILLEYTTWPWKDTTKLKNVYREYTPILGAAVYEQLFVNLYRKELLTLTEAGNLRAGLSCILNAHAARGPAHDLCEESGGDQHYIWWDKIEVAEMEVDTMDKNVVKLELLTSVRKYTGRLQSLVDSVERLSKSRIFEDSTMTNKVPKEIGRAIDFLQRVGVLKRDVESHRLTVNAGR